MKLQVGLTSMDKLNFGKGVGWLWNLKIRGRLNNTVVQVNISDMTLR